MEKFHFTLHADLEEKGELVVSQGAIMGSREAKTKEDVRAQLEQEFSDELEDGYEITSIKTTQELEES